jgi:hypothetical protein
VQQVGDPLRADPHLLQSPHRFSSAKGRSAGARSLARAVLALFSLPLVVLLALRPPEGGAHRAAGALVAGVGGDLDIRVPRGLDDAVDAGAGQIAGAPLRASPR